ncbi:molybdopterin molybdotransferase MoeA [Thalassotalea ponticola]|uniref:molybdopterin molybdotransferase MoeA n=1 Tax=Thalassotalea ponticola TaxID=1523392 RepID=UPI0025B5BA95|nr:gephyrin-like molybdotransferase Glp [Thalassotalea ponticola]MDN3651893.1 molybdopterin molybdotransferase MoeA [Thalassotalea ponticola]
MSDLCALGDMITFEQAKTMLLNVVKSVDEIDTVPIEQSGGRVIADTVYAPVNVPPYDNSAMDGYAFHFEHMQEHTTPLNVVGTAFAGRPFEGQVKADQCVRIMTGGKIPDGCDTVVMQEQTTQQKQAISISKLGVKGANVRLAGEDIKLGSVIFARGHTITPADIGLLASIGVAHVSVFRPVKVALLATGDELKSPGETLADGEIYESNRFVLTAMLAKLQVEVIDFGVIGDDVDALRTAFRQADAVADVVISSGGVSVGAADYTKQILAELGRIEFWKIAMKPGKPLAFGCLDNSVFFGLPGNPVSAAVTLYQLAIPAIEKMQGKTTRERAKLLAKSVSDLKKSPGRMEFHRGIWSVTEQGEIVVQSTGTQSSGVLTSVAKANCFILLAREQAKVHAEEKVWIEPFDFLLS